MSERMRIALFRCVAEKEEWIYTRVFVAKTDGTPEDDRMSINSADASKDNMFALLMCLDLWVCCYADVKKEKDSEDL